MSQQNTCSFPRTVSAASRTKQLLPLLLTPAVGVSFKYTWIFLNIERNQAGNTHTERVGRGGLLWVEVEQTCARLQKNIWPFYEGVKNPIRRQRAVTSEHRDPSGAWLGPLGAPNINTQAISQILRRRAVTCPRVTLTLSWCWNEVFWSHDRLQERCYICSDLWVYAAPCWPQGSSTAPCNRYICAHTQVPAAHTGCKQQIEQQMKVCRETDQITEWSSSFKSGGSYKLIIINRCLNDVWSRVSSVATFCIFDVVLGATFIFNVTFSLVSLEISCGVTREYSRTSTVWLPVGNRRLWKIQGWNSSDPFYQNHAEKYEPVGVYVVVLQLDSAPYGTGSTRSGSSGVHKMFSV